MAGKNAQSVGGGIMRGVCVVGVIGASRLC